MSDNRRSIPYSQRRKQELQKKRSKEGRAPLSLALKEPSPFLISELKRVYDCGVWDRAELMAREMAQDYPEFPLGWTIAGLILAQTGRLEEALSFFQRHTQLLPEDAGGFNNLGNILKDLGRVDAAIKSYQKSIKLDPTFADPHNNLGVALGDLRRLTDSEAHFRHATELNPQAFQFHCNLANALREQRRYDEAEQSFRETLRINPHSAEAYNNLGLVLSGLGRLRESEACFREAMRIHRDYPEAYYNLGILQQDLGQFEASEASLREAIRLRMDYEEARSALLYLLSSVKQTSPNLLREEAFAFGRLVSEKAHKRFIQWPLTRNPRVLRVGLVSGDLKNHPVGYFLEAFCQSLDPSRVELLAFPTTNEVDDLTERLRPSFRRWIPLKGIQDAKASQLIHQEGVHILVDLAGHTSHHRLGVFGYKPAPVQVSWLGYWATTGVAEMDYLLGDPFVTPEEDDDSYLERVWRLPETRFCLTPPDVSVFIDVPPLTTQGYPTFGCFNNLSKVSEEVLAVWSRILYRLPNARLFLKSKQLADASIGAELLQKCERLGIKAERLILEGPSPRSEYLAAYNRIDIALDPFPYPGGTTTAEALWMGVPVITQKGSTLLSRQGEGIARVIGESGWIAVDELDYVEKAVRVANDREYVIQKKKTLRQQVLRSPLFDANRFAKNFESAMWGMWEGQKKIPQG